MLDWVGERSLRRLPNGTSTMKFAICNEMFEGWEFARICDTAAGIGYTGIEVAPFTLAPLAGNVLRAERAAMRKAADDSGLEIIGLHWVLAKTEGFHINHPDEAIRDRTIAYFGDLAALCADLGGSVMIFGSPMQRNVHESLSRNQAWDYALDTFSQIVPVLEERDVTLCLEPLGPEETDFINTAEEAAAMIREVGSPYVRLLLDVKAMSTESTPIPDIIRANRDIVRHFHANDANRRGPGFGNTDFVPIAAALREINYTGWVSVEVFDFSPDPVTIAGRSMDCLKNAFVQEKE